ncbi:hypothetical protein BDF22DRAFT_741983 [Syncephalis plumigaleata]|nr:hypothetical protein BDF22DRAFT_741983 [Syncephalis plumigaleata]
MTNNADNTMMMPTLRWCDRHNCKMNHWCLGWDDLCMRWADRDLNRTIHSLLYRDEPAMVCSYVSVRGNRFNHVQLSSCARRVRDSPNAGGCSILSEIFSCEIVRRWLGAKLVFTEMEVPYSAWRGPMTDYICEIGDGLAISVSVTRAMTAPNKTYTRADARRLLCKKMRGIIGASKRIRLSNNDEEEEEEEEEARNLIYTSRHCRGSSQLYKQILHIWAPSGRVARMIRQEWRRLSRELIDTTLVVVSIVDQAWVFTNRV